MYVLVVESVELLQTSEYICTYVLLTGPSGLNAIYWRNVEVRG